MNCTSADPRTTGFAALGPLHPITTPKGQLETSLSHIIPPRRQRNLDYGQGPRTSRAKPPGPQARRRYADQYAKLTREAADNLPLLGERGASENTSPRLYEQTLARSTDLPQVAKRRAGEASLPSLQDLTQAAWSHVQSMIDWTTAYLPQPVWFVGAEGTDACFVNEPRCVQDMAGGSPEQRFEQVCLRSGFTNAQVDQIKGIWKDKRIPLNEETAPRFGEQHLAGPWIRLDKAPTSGGKNFRASLQVDGETHEYHIKMYSSASKIYAKSNNKFHYEWIGLDPANPKFEIRNILVSRIAGSLGWADLVPAAAMGYFEGKSCLVTDFIVGSWFSDHIKANPALTEVLGYYGRNHLNASPIPLGNESLGSSYSRLSILSLLVGDVDRHARQYLLVGDPPAAIVGIDWDRAFGKNLHNHKQMQKLMTMPGQVSNAPRFPTDEEMLKFRDEFLSKLTPALLRELADGLLSDEEIEALVDRFENVRTRFVTADMDAEEKYEARKI